MRVVWSAWAKKKRIYCKNPLSFPILGQRTVGIARLAAESEKAGDGHLVEFRTMEPRSLLNRSVSKRIPWLAWSINPYRGCEFGCRYCYARYTHEFIHPAERSAGQENPSQELSAELFEREIYIKQHAAWLLRQELKQVRPGEQIALGTATDPYQPIERHAQVTRSLLEVFAEQRGLRLGIVTKSTLIERDIDLLVRIGERYRPRTLHWRLPSPRPTQSSRGFSNPARRGRISLQDSRSIAGSGPPGRHPLLAADAGNYRYAKGSGGNGARRAKQAGPTFFGAQPLFLKPCSKPVFLRFIRSMFPSWRRRTRLVMVTGPSSQRPIQERVAALVRAVVRKMGIDAQAQRFSGRVANPPKLLFCGQDAAIAGLARSPSCGPGTQVRSA